MMIDNYKDLSVGKYLKILDMCEDGAIDNVQRQVGILSILSDMPEDEIMNLPLPEYMEMSARLGFLKVSPELPEKPAGKYKVGKWILVPVVDTRKMTAAQYIDFQAFAAKEGQYVVETLSCLAVPEGKKYNDGYDIVELQGDIRKEMPVADAMCLYAFFLSSLERSTASILISSAVATAGTRIPIRKKVEMIKTAIRTAMLLRRNGTGLHALTESRRHADAHGKLYGR